MNDFEEKNISNAIKCDEEKLHPASFFSKVSSEKQSAQYGDVIGVYRQGRGYEHYGIYVDDECVIEYAGEGGVAKELLNAEVRETTLEKFIGKSKNYFVLSFSETKKTPVKQRMLKGEIKETECTTYANNIDEVEEQKFDNILEELTAKYFDIYNVVCPPSGYHLYSPSETVKRAISCKGEKEYNFFFHNCEHFAVWCKTGLYTSFQVKKYKDTAWKMFDLLFNVTGVIAPNPLNGAVNLMRKFNVEDIITKNISKDKTFEIRVKEMTDEHLEFFIPSVYQYSIYDIDYEKLKKSGITLISFDIDDTIQDSLLTKGANQVQKKFRSLLENSG